MRLRFRKLEVDGWNLTRPLMGYRTNTESGQTQNAVEFRASACDRIYVTHPKNTGYFGSSSSNTVDGACRSDADEG